VHLVKAKGGKVTREPGPVNGGSSITAFIEDPDGYTFELLQRGPTPEPFCQVMLRVGDLDRSINFYKKVKQCLSWIPEMSCVFLHHFTVCLLCHWLFSTNSMVFRFEGVWHGATP